MREIPLSTPSPFKTPCFNEPYLNVAFIFYFELHLNSLAQIRNNWKVDWKVQSNEEDVVPLE